MHYHNDGIKLIFLTLISYMLKIILIKQFKSN